MGAGRRSDCGGQPGFQGRHTSGGGASGRSTAWLTPVDMEEPYTSTTHAASLRSLQQCHFCVQMPNGLPSRRVRHYFTISRVLALNWYSPEVVKRCPLTSKILQDLSCH